MTCRKCNSECKPSKGLINSYLIEVTIDENKQCWTDYTNAKLVDCYKCVNCGHSFIPSKLDKQVENFKNKLI
jgi:hypothetical protein